MYPSLFCHLHHCPDFSFNLSSLLDSFWIAFPFLQVSFLVTKIKDLTGKPGLPLPTLLATKFSCCISYCLVEVGDRWVHIIIFIYQHGKKCKSTTSSCLKSTQCFRKLLDVNPYNNDNNNNVFVFRGLHIKYNALTIGWVGFIDFLRCVWKVIFIMSWSLPIFAPGSVLGLADLISGRNRCFTKMQSIWLWCVPSWLCHVHLLDSLRLPRMFASASLL